MATARKTTSKAATEKVDNRPKVNADKLAAFEEVLKIANKKIESESGNLISRLSDRPMDVETISTGSSVLDSIAGGGFPKGRLIEIYGEEASGKTSVALNAIANVQKEGGIAVFVDLENALDPRYARVLGVDTDALAVSQPDYAEQALNLVHLMASSGVVDIIVVDSIASMVPQVELQGDMEQQTIGLLARLMSKALRKLITVANRTGTTIIFINQTREAVGKFSPMGTPKTTPGGKAMKFYASQRIEVKRLEQVKDGKEIIGNKVRMRVVKNKIAPPFGVGETVLTFGRGINHAAEMIEVGPEHGVIHRPNNRRYEDAETGELIGNSKADAVAALEKDHDLLLRLQERMLLKIQANLFNGEIKSDNPDADSKNDTELDEAFALLDEEISNDEAPVNSDDTEDDSSEDE